MRDEDLDEMFGRTGAVMTTLLERARDAVAAGASRRDFFTRTASLAGTAALGAGAARLMRPIAAHAATAGAEYAPENAKLVLTLAATAESLATTFYYYGLASGSLPNVNSAANRNYFQAAVVQEFTHLEILGRLGAAPLATSFYFPDNMFTDENVFFPTASLLEDYFISAYIAAAREFSGAVVKGIPSADPTAIGLAVQIGGIECEHRALLRVAANLNPANDRLIESALVHKVSDVVGPLTPFLQGGQGFSGTYQQPHRGAVNAIAEPFGFASFPKYKIF